MMHGCVILIALCVVIDGNEIRKNAKYQLLDLGFLELDVLAHDGIVLFHYQFFGRVAGVLLGDIEEASAGARQKLDFLDNRLGHDRLR